MYKSMFKERWSPILIILISMAIYSLIRATLMLTNTGMSAYEEVFKSSPRLLTGSMWLLVFVLSIYSIFSKKYLPWRLTLIFASFGFSTWAISFIFAYGTRTIDGVLTYTFLACTLLVVAIRADDPRAIKRLKEAVWNSEIISSTQQ